MASRLSRIMTEPTAHLCLEAEGLPNGQGRFKNETFLQKHHKKTLKKTYKKKMYRKNRIAHLWLEAEGLANGQGALQAALAGAVRGEVARHGREGGQL